MERQKFDALIEARRGYLKLASDLDKLLMNVALGLLPILGGAIYYAEVKGDWEIYALIPIMIGLFGVFYAYCRANVYNWWMMALDFEEQLGEQLGDKGLMRPEPRKLSMTSVRIFNWVLGLVLGGIFVFGVMQVGELDWSEKTMRGYRIAAGLLLFLAIYSVRSANLGFKRYMRRVEEMRK